MKLCLVILSDNRFLSVAYPAWSPVRFWDKYLRKFRAGTVNVNTLKGGVCELVATKARRKVDHCCVQVFTAV